MSDAQGMGERVGRGINEYLNHYVLIADGKAVALAAASLVIAGMSLGERAQEADPVLRLVGLVMAGLSAACAGAALYPRTPHSGNGHIFWGDIKAYESAEKYWKSLAALTEDDLGREYARQNFLVSAVLLRKNQLIRMAVWFFVVASLSTAIAYGVK